MNEQARIPVVAVVGPTAGGKTRLAVEIALRYGGEVVSADSMQVYKGLTIGTAKPSAEEMRGVPHHMIDVADPARKFSVADYVAMAGDCIARIHARGALPVVAGGTGLYVDSLLSGVVFSKTKADEALRTRLRETAEREGGEALLARLRAFDPETAARLHPANLGRIIRAIEVYETTGVTMTEMQRRSRLAPSVYDTLKIGLSFSDRALLYARINDRVDAMLAAGLLDEARRVMQTCAGRDTTALQAIGYKELGGFLRGEITLPEAVENLKRETRRYAKRQLTWFRRDASVHWIDAGIYSYENICKQSFELVDKWYRV